MSVHEAGVASTWLIYALNILRMSTPLAAHACGDVLVDDCAVLGCKRQPGLEDTLMEQKNCPQTHIATHGCQNSHIGASSRLLHRRYNSNTVVTEFPHVSRCRAVGPDESTQGQLSADMPVCL